MLVRSRFNYLGNYRKIQREYPKKKAVKFKQLFKGDL